MFAALAAPAQESVTLRQAVQMAIEKNPSIHAADASTNAAGNRIKEARAGFLPKVNYTESWTRSDNPVFVFSSLLTQRQFTAANFDLGALNHPDFLNNFQSLVTADQTLFDAKQTKRAVKTAELSRDAAREGRRLTETEVIANVARAYYGAVLGVAQLDAANQAVKSAEADLERAQTVRAAGMSTDSDVLSIRVHLAAMKEQQVRRSADLEVAYAALNDAIGLPLETKLTLATALTPQTLSGKALADYETTSLQERAEARQAKLAVNIAESQSAAARSNLLPKVALHGAMEADRQQFYDKGGANWTVSASLQWNLFNGYSDKARIEETKSLIKTSEAERERASSTIRLQVRRAYADLTAAAQRIDLAKASVDEAEESLRIVKNRYGAGITTVTELLRTETAAFEARTRYLAAVHDQRVAAMLLEMAAGTLHAESEVLNQ